MSRRDPIARSLQAVMLITGLLLVCVTDATMAEPGIELLENRMTADPPYTEPSVPSAAPSPLWGMAVVLLMTTMVLGASLIPSKRGHQD